jgi:hypothetical protein
MGKQLTIDWRRIVPTVGNHLHHLVPGARPFRVVVRPARARAIGDKTGNPVGVLRRVVNCGICPFAHTEEREPFEPGMVNDGFEVLQS